MLKNYIEELQYRLNLLIDSESSYEDIYKLSIELDELIVAYHRLYDQH